MYVSQSSTADSLVSLWASKCDLTCEFLRCTDAMVAMCLQAWHPAIDLWLYSDGVYMTIAVLLPTPVIMELVAAACKWSAFKWPLSLFVRLQINHLYFCIWRLSLCVCVPSLPVCWQCAGCSEFRWILEVFFNLTCLICLTWSVLQRQTCHCSNFLKH